MVGDDHVGAAAIDLFCPLDDQATSCGGQPRSRPDADHPVHGPAGGVQVGHHPDRGGRHQRAQESRQCGEDRPGDGDQVAHRLDDSHRPDGVEPPSTLRSVKTSKADLRRSSRLLDGPTTDENLRVVRVVRRFLEDSSAHAVLTFLAMPGEIDLAALPSRLPAIEWLVTRTPDEGWLTIHRFDAPRERHRFGFDQPVAGSPLVPVDEVDVVLVPGLAFDLRGGRLGRGRGYYDELIARCRRDVTLVGVTLDRRMVEAVPMDAHDRRVDWVATESGVYSTRSDSR